LFWVLFQIVCDSTYFLKCFLFKKIFLKLKHLKILKTIKEKNLFKKKKHGVITITKPGTAYNQVIGACIHSLLAMEQI